MWGIIMKKNTKFQLSKAIDRVLSREKKNIQRFLDHKLENQRRNYNRKKNDGTRMR